jgi:hypothetical protein
MSEGADHGKGRGQMFTGAYLETDATTIGGSGCLVAPSVLADSPALHRGHGETSGQALRRPAQRGRDRVQGVAAHENDVFLPLPPCAHGYLVPTGGTGSTVCVQAGGNAGTRAKRRGASPKLALIFRGGVLGAQLGRRLVERVRVSPCTRVKTVSAGRSDEDRWR